MTRFPWKKCAATYVVGLLIGLYSVFVALCFWNWLGVPLLHIPPISFLQAVCLMFLIGLFARTGFPLNLQGEAWRLKSMEFAIGLCIPEEKLEQWKEYCNDQALPLFEAFGMIFAGLAANTALLGVGFALHLAITK